VGTLFYTSVVDWKLSVAHKNGGRWTQTCRGGAHQWLEKSCKCHRGVCQLDQDNY